MVSSTSTPQLSTAATSPAATGVPSPASLDPAQPADSTQIAAGEDADEHDVADAPKQYDANFIEQESSESAKLGRLTRLNALLDKSSIYTRILSEKMEKQRIERIKAEARLAARKEKLASGEKDAEFVPVAERRSGRSAAETATVTDRKKAVDKGKGKDVGKRKAEKFEMEGDIKAALESTTAGDDQEGAPKKPKADVKENQAGGHGTQPALVTGAVMRDYQLAGLQWLISLFEQGINGILADEMGLGKTLQTISLFAHLRAHGVWGPFMVVCPMSVLQNWENEFKKFTPDIPVLQYYGNPDERRRIRQTLLTPPTDAPASVGKMQGGGGTSLAKMSKSARRKALDNPPKVVENTTATFPIVLTTFDMAIKDAKFLRGLQWKYVVVDEGHRLKNMDCLLIRELKTFKSANRLILTGTPLHNNLSELWSLLNFILPDIFDDLESFQQWFDLDSDIRDPTNPGAKLISDETSQSIVHKLHDILKPFLLRRLKVDVEKNLPPKKEYLLHAPVTKGQKELYDQVVSRTLRAFLIKQKSGENARNLDGLDLADDDNDDESDDEVELALVANAEAEPERHDDGRVKRQQRVGVARKDYTKDLLNDDNKYFKALEAQREEELRREAEGNGADALEVGRIHARKMAAKSVNNMHLLNSAMQLRKVANHPFLFDWPIDPKTNQPAINRDLVEASGKMLLLNRLLDALFERKHKVLLFSQFTSMLDIIEDWALEYKGIEVYRIDGGTKQADRQAQMNAFNLSGEEDGVCRLFILSTRAGGLGINLVAADTVIFYDQDWNPQMDLQAQDRAHRIGQKRPVLVFRLVTAHSIEEKILQRAGAKRRLEAMVIADGKFKGGAGDGKRVSTLDEAAALLKLEGDKIDLVDAGDKIISDEDLELLLDRSPAAYGREKGWHSTKSTTTATAAAARAARKGQNTAFEVFEAAKDDVNDGLAKIRGD